MNLKRLIPATLAVFITFQVTDFLIHSLILASSYAALQELWRPDMMSKMWIMTLTSLFMSFMFVFIFIKGYEKKGICEGFRFGIIIGLFMSVTAMLNQYVVYPVPFSMVIQWLIYGLIQFILAGIVVSLIYKPKA